MDLSFHVSLIRRISWACLVAHESEPFIFCITLHSQIQHLVWSCRKIGIVTVVDRLIYLCKFMKCHSFNFFFIEVIRFHVWAMFYATSFVVNSWYIFWCGTVCILWQRCCVGGLPFFIAWSFKMVSDVFT